MKKYIIGIDEVGRGALAGPVVVTAVLLGTRDLGRGINKNKKLGELKDSKKLSVKQREAWFSHFKNHPDISFAVARVYPRGIERLNISGAANLAAKRAYEKLIRPRRDLGGNRQGLALVFLDGGLFIGDKKSQPKFAKTIIKADETIPAVSIASIIAKVTRDRFMVRLAKKHPRYGFEIHKGYGTALHRNAIKKHGPSSVHRATFLKKLDVLKPEA